MHPFAGAGLHERDCGAQTHLAADAHADETGGEKTVSQPRGGRDQELPQTALGFRLVTDVFLRRLAGRFARQHVTTFVLRVAGVALDPFPFYLVALNGQIQPLPQIDILDRLFVGGFPAALLPVMDPAGDAPRTYWLSVLSVTAQGTVSASSATIAAIISMRLLVVRRKPSLKVFRLLIA